MAGYKEYDLYKKSYEMALKVHQITREFPDIERYELGSQMRKASKSIPLNFGEGYGKKDSAREFKRYVMMAIGSCDEMKILLDFARDLNYLSGETHQELMAEYETIGKMLFRLHQKWQKL